MLEYKDPEKLHGAARNYLNGLVQAGLPKEDLMVMVQELPDATPGDQEQPLERDLETIFPVLREGLIDVPSACGKYGVSSQAIHAALRRGALTPVGRLQSANGGPGSVVLNEAELVAQLRGSDSTDNLPIYMELPPGTIDVPTALRKYNLKQSMLRSWIDKGQVIPVGRLRAPAKGGGYLVLNEAELQTYIAAPKRRGRPKKPSTKETTS